MTPDAAPSRDWTGASCISACRLRPVDLDNVQNVVGYATAAGGLSLDPLRGQAETAVEPAWIAGS
jgi:hypothetical protein